MAAKYVPPVVPTAAPQPLLVSIDSVGGYQVGACAAAVRGLTEIVPEQQRHGRTCLISTASHPLQLAAVALSGTVWLVATEAEWQLGVTVCLH